MGPSTDTLIRTMTDTTTPIRKVERKQHDNTNMVFPPQKRQYTKDTLQNGTGMPKYHNFLNQDLPQEQPTAPRAAQNR